MGSMGSTLSDGLRIAYRMVREPVGSLLGRARHALGWNGPARIQPYRGYGNAARLKVVGRVVEEHATRAPRPEDSWRRNLAATWRRFRVRRVPDVAVRARLDGIEVEGRADDLGYFELILEPPEPRADDRSTREVTVVLVEPQGEAQRAVSTLATVVVPSVNARFGVISDIDDTIVYSHATDLLRLIRITALQNSRTRAPLHGAAAFYRALARGADGQRDNPVFYVSSAAWNLYDLLDDFIAHHGFPSGPILLRDFGIERNTLFRSSHRHKIDKVEQILAATGDLPFVLIGDAGQHDPDLYQEIALAAPERIAAIYIRSVAWRDRSADMARRIEELAARGVAMRFVADTRAAADDALRRGLIAPEALAAITADRRADRALETGDEDAIAARAEP